MDVLDFMVGCLDLALFPFSNISNIIFGLPLVFMFVCSLFSLVRVLMRR